MPTQCSAEQFDFGMVEGRAVEAAFDAGLVTSDAGGLLLGAADRAIDLVDRFAACFRDHRRQDLIEHAVTTLIGQRVFGIALGYEDLNDHDQLRHDPVLAVLAGKLSSTRETCAPVAGKSTLNRLELSREEPTRYHKIACDDAAIEALPVTLFLEAHQRPPKQIILDLDATDDPLHGHQEGRFFHGYYDCYCYLPLYIFCGRHLLLAKLRPSDIDAAAGSVEAIERIVRQIRAHWPHVRFLLRADSGFAREALMAWCEQNRVDYVFGLARNVRLVADDRTASWLRPGRWPRRADNRRAASRTSSGARSTAGAAGAASSPRRSGHRARPIRASSSPRSSALRRERDSSTRRSTALAATWRTASRNASSISLPTGPRPPPCAPTSCACGSPRWPMC